MKFQSKWQNNQESAFLNISIKAGVFVKPRYKVHFWCVAEVYIRRVFLVMTLLFKLSSVHTCLPVIETSFWIVDMTCHHGLVYQIMFLHEMYIFFFSFSAGCPCGDWCHGFTTCLLYVGPLKKFYGIIGKWVWPTGWWRFLYLLSNIL